ncbi:CobD/CbiB family cobalamin biosynthesis protein [Deinococcus sp. HMF7620]|uniref:Cobalamin biosynthesis protein CobD n=1 Tax=Deinococcus arboris TaxID=2682977 RepID=A0A7C9HRT1_9DEIO|nr:CobD/CbiB family cobalamin biosynthesis protein [Deinococcus arboris]MVN87113.1 CobD/CbiB family cobalamin biosynthesis protein [Deinococcus arboris]
MSRRALLLALTLDVLGEPPAALHPVVWMGRFLKRARRTWTATTPRGQLEEGARSWLGGALLTGAVATLGNALPWPLQGALLKPLLARKALFDAAQQVQRALQGGDLPEARRLLAWHLVSRETSGLTASEVAGACIESLAENLSDSVVAPLLAYRVGGLPLAAVYRYANTADAMWGYRTPDLEDAGKAAARADDLLNLLPARLTALCALAAAGGRGWRVWAADRRAPLSPNAGHPMSAFAGALGLRLDKRDAAGQPLYVLNGAGRPPHHSDIARALVLARGSLMLATAALLLWPLHQRRRPVAR